MAKSKLYIFVIDTDSCSGNYEREMASFITGRNHEYGHGSEDKAIELFPEYFDNNGEWFDDNVFVEDGEHGEQFQRLATEGWFNNGMGDVFEDKPENEAATLEAYKRSVHDRFNKDLYHVERWAKEEKEKGGKRDHMAEAIKHRDALLKIPLSKYPAYNSLGILFSKKPTKKLFEDMKDMAQKFVDWYTRKNAGILAPDKKIKITGFRMLEEATTIIYKPVKY